MPPASSQRNTGVLTLDNVAEELGCTPLHVQRLIARGRLKAQRMQKFARGAIESAKKNANSEEVRILASEVARYVADGAEDFTAPDFSTAMGGWFLDPESNFRDTANAELSAACEPQVLSDKEVIANFARESSSRVSSGYVAKVSHFNTVKLRLTSEVQEANKSARRSKYSPELNEVTRRCKTWLRVLAVSRIRELARRAIPEVVQELIVEAGGMAIRNAATGFSVNPLDALYSDKYEAICERAFEKLQELKAVAFSRVTAIPNSGGSVTTTYVLPFSSIAFDAQLLFDLAF